MYIYTGILYMAVGGSVLVCPGEQWRGLGSDHHRCALYSNARHRRLVPSVPHPPQHGLLPPHVLHHESHR